MFTEKEKTLHDFVYVILNKITHLEDFAKRLSFHNERQQNRSKYPLHNIPRAAPGQGEKITY